MTGLPLRSSCTASCGSIHITPPLTVPTAPSLPSRPRPMGRSPCPECPCPDTPADGAGPDVPPFRLSISVARRCCSAWSFCRACDSSCFATLTASRMRLSTFAPPSLRVAFSSDNVTFCRSRLVCLSWITFKRATRVRRVSSGVSPLNTEDLQLLFGQIGHRARLSLPMILVPGLNHRISPQWVDGNKQHHRHQDFQQGIGFNLHGPALLTRFAPCPS
ncbi:Uncharacterised protein [Serratia fonticola]|uniref:Uncharacterized protein n=1 Tax=Serratia fonticola TaxID=47917 RepID=A0A4U9UVT6_SERFO|nr:Uncharacterised protein [Serratia fonticola]